jgi:hypothetical protein
VEKLNGQKQYSTYASLLSRQKNNEEVHHDDDVTLGKNASWKLRALVNFWKKHKTNTNGEICMIK